MCDGAHWQRGGARLVHSRSTRWSHN